MNLMKFFVILTFTLAGTAYAAETLFHVKKSLNTSNVLYLKVNLDQQCKLVKKNNKYVDIYWHEDGSPASQRQELSAMEASKLSLKITYVKSDGSELDFTSGNKEKVEKYIPNPEIKVEARKLNSTCQVKAYQEYNGKKIQVKSIWVQVNLLGVDYVVVYGANPDGSAFKKKIVKE